ncbi:MFS transporter, partial [Pseudidiomarina aestuarii]
FISLAPEPQDPAFAKVVAVMDDQASRDALMAALEQEVEAGQYPEARVRVYRLLYGPPVNWPITFRILGPDMDQLRDIGHQVRDLMAEHPNTHNSHLEWDEKTPIYQLDIDHSALQLQGLTPTLLADQLQLLLEGAPISAMYEDIRSVSINVRGREAGQALTPQRFKSLEVLNSRGDKVSLAQLATLKVAYEEPVIRRYNRDNYLNVIADIRGAQPNTVTAELWEQIADFR